MQINSNQRSYFILYLAIILLAINGLFSKTIPLDAVSQTFLRSVFAAATITTILLIIRRRILLANNKDYFGVYGLGILMGLHWVTFFHAMQVSTVAIGMLALFSFPIFTVLFEPLFSKNKMYHHDIIATLILFLGIIIMASPKILEFESTLLQGIGWGVLSAIFFVFRNLSQKYHFTHISSDRLMLHQLIAIFIMLAAFIDIESTKEMNTNAWVTTVLMGVFTTAMAHTLLVASYKRLSAKTVAMIGSLQTPIAAGLAWWILGEALTWNIILGGGIIISVAVFESFKQSKENIN